jgi:hypothetical protein
MVLDKKLNNSYVAIKPLDSTSILICKPLMFRIDDLSDYATVNLFFTKISFD